MCRWFSHCLFLCAPSFGPRDGCAFDSDHFLVSSLTCLILAYLIEKKSTRIAWLNLSTVYLDNQF